ncbi:hypothetical protein TthAA11_15350 [Thermus thermophilus]|uniref:Uncharacterized protein n=1 Tax=Thermus thermophilus TaxID=274 RepID=A0AAD1NXI4_THETH|nr:hypothetical protein TthAA11_15350 [Thermus thermophilus]
MRPMSATGLEVFDRTLHKTHAWLKAIMEELGTEDRHKAYLALRAVCTPCATGSPWRRWPSSPPSSPCWCGASTTRAGTPRANP